MDKNKSKITDPERVLTLANFYKLNESNLGNSDNILFTKPGI